MREVGPRDAFGFGLILTFDRFNFGFWMVQRFENGSKIAWFSDGQPLSWRQFKYSNVRAKHDTRKLGVIVSEMD